MTHARRARQHSDRVSLSSAARAARPASIGEDLGGSVLSGGVSACFSRFSRGRCHPAIVGAEPSSPDRPAALGRGRGPIRRAVRAVLAEAKAENRMTLEHEVRAVIAERFAELVDRASEDGDGAAVVRAGDKLLEVLDTLPVRKPGGGGAGDSGSGERARILSIMDGPPAVGDTADG